MDEKNLPVRMNGPSEKSPVVPFSEQLAANGLSLLRKETTVLQVNIGLLCNQTCRHCHLTAGPARRELMNNKTCDEVIAFATRNRFEAIDITGGAPELNPSLGTLLERLAALSPRVMLRSNLTAITEGKRNDLIEICKQHGVVIIASLPSLSRSQLESQRGTGVFEKSIAALKLLNSAGYGCSETGLELDLVMNPTGAFLPVSQTQAEKRLRTQLGKKWRITFNHLYTFANVPLGRYRQWLERSGNYEGYMQKLAAAFNTCAIEGLMCRSLVSVSWDGYLFDCDFNLAARISIGGKRTHISELGSPPPPGTPIATGDHCYGCTAGAGFT